MTPTAASVIVPGVDLPVALPLTIATDPTQQSATPATGLSGVAVYLSDTFGGRPIDASLVFPATESGTAPGTYLAVITGSATLPFLAGEDGRTIYLIAEYGTKLLQSLSLYVAPGEG